MHKSASFACLVGLCGLVAVWPASANPIAITGSASATYWQGTQASAKVTYRDGSTGASRTVTNSLNVLSDIGDDFEGPSGGGGFAKAAPSYLKTGGGSLDPNDIVETSGYFRDEIYFSIDSGLFGFLEFDFDVMYSLLNFQKDLAGNPLPAGDCFAEFGLELWYQSADGPLLLDDYRMSLASNGTVATAPVVFSDVVTLSTRGAGDYYLANGRYFPLTVTMWTEAWKGNAGGILERQYIRPPFDDVRAYVYGDMGPAGYPTRLLDDDEFTLYSTTIPEPASMVLIGLGIVGLWAGRRRR